MSVGGAAVTGSGTTVGATQEIGEPAGLAATVWYKFTPSANALLSASVSPAGVSYLVYSGSSVANLTLVNRITTPSGSILFGQLAAGTTYYIQVGTSSPGSAFTYSFSLTPVTTTATNATSAIPLTIGTSSPVITSNDSGGATNEPTCQTSTSIPSGYTCLSMAWYQLTVNDTNATPSLFIGMIGVWSQLYDQTYWALYSASDFSKPIATPFGGANRLTVSNGGTYYLQVGTTSHAGAGVDPFTLYLLGQ
ncbi:MAG TPA: hypothetical protein VF960_07685 [Chloroflexota bacterium]